LAVTPASEFHTDQERPTVAVLAAGGCIDTIAAIKAGFKPDFLSSGQPCIDYSYSGSEQGSEGDTGWMFTKQVNIINHQYGSMGTAPIGKDYS